MTYAFAIRNTNSDIEICTMPTTSFLGAKVDRRQIERGTAHCSRSSDLIARTDTCQVCCWLSLFNLPSSFFIGPAAVFFLLACQHQE